MPTIRISRTFVPGVLLLAALVACQQPAEEEPAPADTAEMGAETAMEEEPPAQETSRLSVTNPMPHAMIVEVQTPDGTTSELGTVPANGEQTFTLEVAPGETVTVSAHDEAQTHEPTTEITLEAESTWTIQ